ncbi:hypothetical protein D3C80_1082910 [compost metagenome]
MGNSPPARKLAASPLVEVRFGSAKVRSRPTRSKASRQAFAFVPVTVFQAAVATSVMALVTDEPGPVTTVSCVVVVVLLDRLFVRAPFCP